MFANNAEGKLGKMYTELTDYYPAMLNEILSMHLNPAEIYDPRGQKYQKLQEKQASLIADKMARKRFGDKYTKEQYSEVYDNASRIAYAELSDMFTFSSQKYSSKFLEKRNIKLPEIVKIDGKKVQVYETAYENTITPYANGMAKLLANL